MIDWDILADDVFTLNPDKEGWIMYPTFTNKESGSATSTSALHLVDSAATFVTNSVVVGDKVKNTTNNLVTRVKRVDSETDLLLEDDIMLNGHNYVVGTYHFDWKEDSVGYGGHIVGNYKVDNGCDYFAKPLSRKYSEQSFLYGNWIFYLQTSMGSSVFGTVPGMLGFAHLANLQSTGSSVHNRNRMQAFLAPNGAGTGWLLTVGITDELGNSWSAQGTWTFPTSAAFHEYRIEMFYNPILHKLSARLFYNSGASGNEYRDEVSVTMDADKFVRLNAVGTWMFYGSAGSYDCYVRTDRYFFKASDRLIDPQVLENEEVVTGKQIELYAVAPRHYTAGGHPPVRKLYYILRRLSDGYYWNGTSWTASMSSSNILEMTSNALTSMFHANDLPDTTALTDDETYVAIITGDWCGSTQKIFRVFKDEIGVAGGGEGTVHEKLGALTGSGDDVRTRLVGIDSDLATIDTEIGNMQTDVTTIQSNIGTKGAFGDLHQKLGSYSGASGDNNNVKDDIAAITPSNPAAVWSYSNRTLTGVGSSGIAIESKQDALQSTADDIETDTQDIQNRLPSALESGYMKSIVKAKDSSLGLTTQEKADVNAEADQALTDYAPSTATQLSTAETNIRNDIAAVDAKIDTIDTNVDAVIVDIDDVKGTGFVKDTDSLVNLSHKAGSKGTDLIFDNLATHDTHLTSVGNSLTIEINANETKIDANATHLLDIKGSGFVKDTDSLVDLSHIAGTKGTDAIYDDLATHDAHLTTVETNLKAEIDANETKIDTLQTNLGSKGSDGDVHAKLGAFSGTGGDDVKTRLVDIKTVIDDTNSDLDAHDTHLTSVESNLSSQMTTMESNLSSQMTTMETNLTSEIDDNEDKLDRVLADVSVDVNAPQEGFVPATDSSIDQTGGIDDDDTEVTLADGSDFAVGGLIKIENELIAYTGRTGNQLTGLVRGVFDTTAVAHNDATPVYQAREYAITVTIKDKDGNMQTPDSAPAIDILSQDGTTVFSGSMSGSGGAYYTYFDLISSNSNNGYYDIEIDVVVNAKTLTFKRTFVYVVEPSSRNDVDKILGQVGELICNQDGYWDALNIFHEWTDDMKGALTNAETGSPIDDAYITAWRVVDDVRVNDLHPPGQTLSNVDGNWVFKLDLGTFDFQFYKSEQLDVTRRRTLV